MPVAVDFSYTTNSQEMESPPFCASSVKALFPTVFGKKVSLGCEFAAFACAAQRPRTVSAGWAPWKGK